MNYMKFKGNKNMTDKAKALNTRKLIPARQYNWEILREFGVAQKLEAVLVPDHSDGVKHVDLLRVFRNDKPVYKELTVEFIASFSFTPGERDCDLNTRKTIHFRLFNHKYDMSLIEFAVHLGLQDKDADLNAYDEFLQDAQIEQASNFKINEFWSNVAMVNYNPKNARETHLRNPYFRVLHRYLTWTLLYHQQDEKINEAHLKAMHLIMHSGQEWHVPYQMATMFVAIRSSTWHDLPGGQFVTSIAESLGVLSANATKDFSTPLSVDIKERNVMVTSMILKKEGDNYRLYGDYERKDSLGAIVVGGGNTGASTSRGKRPRTSEDDQGNDQRITLKYVVDLLHMHGHYLDEVAQMLMRVDTRSQARYENPFGTPLPDCYGDGWKLPTTWDMRVQALHDAEDTTNEAAEEPQDEEDVAGDGGNEE